MSRAGCDIRRAVPRNPRAYLPASDSAKSFSRAGVVRACEFLRLAFWSVDEARRTIAPRTALRSGASAPAYQHPVGRDSVSGGRHPERPADYGLSSPLLALVATG